MSAGASLALNRESRRIHVRHDIKVAMDVVVLRSGVPENIPGRCLDLSEGGVGAVVAGAFAPGQNVGVEVRLPHVARPLQIKARVRHQGALRCGLEFVGLPSDQREMISYWKRTAEPAKTDRVPRAEAASEAREVLPRAADKRGRWLRPKFAMIVLVCLLALAAAGWWRWQQSWKELEQNASRQTAPLRVAPEIMNARILARVEPVYPEQARREGKQGTARLDAVIAPDGTVRKLQPISGDEVLVQAATDAVGQWRFEPYRIAGRALEVETAIAIEFRLR